MLSELSISNFGIIESVRLSLESGLTVITGETGAGKSMIIDAIGLLAGGRGSADFVRHGSVKAEIEGLFFIDDNHPCVGKMDELGFETNDGMVVVRREISKNGKSVCRLNGKLITLSTMKEIGRLLIDIHSQHEHQDLLQPERYLPLLDDFGSKGLAEARTSYDNAFSAYVKVKRDLQRLTEDEKTAAQRLDLIRFQVEEIDAAGLEPEEDEQLENEKTKLANFERVYDALQEGYQALNGEQKGLEWVGQAMNHLEGIAEIDRHYGGMHEKLAESYYLLQELTYSMRDSFEGLEYDPERLNLIEERLHEIQKLKRKYGDSVAEILQFRDKAAAELDQLINRDEEADSLRRKLSEFTQELLQKADRLSKQRKKTAEKLIGSITLELEQLQMAKTRFDIRFKTRQKDDERQFFKDGTDEIDFLISTNPGEPLKPLAKVASGGELSRIMLALKSIFSGHDGSTSIIFDEVDTGVSGRAAQAMAEKIFKLSKRSQVFCITHLPQVAAMADTHLFIMKEESNQRTTTDVRRLDDDRRAEEVGRMISGAEMTDLTKQHARELLALASNMKATS